MEKKMGAVTWTHYQVETVWPDSSKKAKEFGTYYAHAFTDVRDPGSSWDKMLVRTQPEIFGAHLRSANDSLHFFTAEAAQAAADFIIKYGRMGAGWEGQEEWRIKYRGKVRARVVEVTQTTVRRLAS